MEFEAETLRDILWGGEGEVLLNEVETQGRWETYYRFVFRPEGSDKLFETTYSKGSTELQDSRPWQYDDVVECHEVEAYEKVVIDYREVK